MYNPAMPNHYRDVIFSAYVRRRQREEEEAVQRQRQPNALASALSARSLPALPTAAGSAPLLGLSAEELHQHRVKESVALGIQRAVIMEKEALEVEHKKRKLEGSDARSRISSRLDKLKALAAKSKATASAPPSVERGNSSVPSDDPSHTFSSEASPSLSLATEVSPSAPLVFQRSSLAAGGYVMTSASPSLPGMSTCSTTRPTIQGKPSSTLLVRFLQDSPLQGWGVDAIAQASTSSSTDSPLYGAVLTQVQQLCSRFGFVRSIAARVYTEDAVAAALARARSPTGAENWLPPVEAVRREQLRVWVRFDSATEAFKAAESLTKERSRALPAAQPVFAVSFYPTGLYDTDVLELREEDLLPSNS